MSETLAMRWSKYRFDQLSAHLLYAIMQLRNEVFVVEQDCVYQDADGQDGSAIHLCGFGEANELVAYARILPKGTTYTEYPSIGRVIVDKDSRGLKLGAALVKRAIQECKSQFGGEGIAISAQCYLLDFYSKLGFEEKGKEYLEDGIPHKKMLLLY
ncbi:MAG: GNAT family N-acetyltransferase [Bacteroidota bacterium]